VHEIIDVHKQQVPCCKAGRGGGCLFCFSPNTKLGGAKEDIKRRLVSIFSGGIGRQCMREQVR
jgi:hypothetical protein